MNIEQTDYCRLNPSWKKFVIWVGILWSLFQLWYSSPLPFVLGFGIANDFQARSIHLAFGLFLAFIIHAFDHHHPDKKLPVIDVILAVAAAFSAAYLFLFYQKIALSLGDPSTLDAVIGIVGILTLLEASRRVVGWPLPIIAACGLLYIIAGPYLPELVAHKGASLDRVITHQWLTTEGVFGVPLGVSTNFIFMFVLFGAMLDKAGAGRYFISIAFALLGHLRGGPAKAAVLASCFTGAISGSSIANVVTTGTFTIPLMKRAGYTGAQAAAVEVSSSTNGQLMPPIMGAAAFLMVEYIGIPYTQIIKHAFLPAIIGYIALLYLVHLEALKENMPYIVVAKKPLRWRMLRWGLNLTGFAIFVGFIYFLLMGLEKLFGAWADWVTIAILIGLYIYFLFLSTTVPQIKTLDTESLTELPPLKLTLKSGLYFLLPIFVLLWCLIDKKLSPGLSAFYGVASLMFIIVTRHWILAWRQPGQRFAALVESFFELKDSLARGAHNMITIAVATAAAGIIVGTISLTGVGQILSEIVEAMSMGSLPLVLVLTAIFCMILGMGLPTTANYIVVASLMVPVISTLAASHGLIIPLIAIHLFVFYFGIMADVTPPVGLASFAAAGIAGENPIKTGIQSFAYSARTLLLPFIFIYNTELLMIGIQNAWHFLTVVTVAIIAMLVFVAGTQGYFFTRSRKWESALLILIALSLFRPELFLNRFFPPTYEVPANQLEQELSSMQPGDSISLLIHMDETSIVRNRTFVFTIPPGPVENRLENIGFEVHPVGQVLLVSGIRLFSPAERAGLNFHDGYIIKAIEKPLKQPSKQWFYIPPLLLLAFVILNQRRRRSL